MRLALAVLGLGTATGAQAAYTPVPVTGFNHDVVANGAGAATTSTTADVDGVNYAFMAPSFVNPAGASPTVFLPATGLINSITTPGLTFQLASYAASNSLRLPATGLTGTGTGSLTLTTPTAAAELYVLATSGSGASTATITVTFTDMTTQVFAAQNIADWYGGTNPAIQGVGRVTRDALSTIDNNATNPRLYQLRLALLPANYAKPIQSVAFNKTSSGGVLNVMGLTINSACTGTPTAGTAVASTASACTATGITLSLTGASTDVGLTYQWQSSTNGGTTWTNIAGATNATYIISGQAMSTQYRAVLTCGTLSATSAPVTVTSVAPTYATLPVTESFENTWVNGCDTRDVPTTFWRNTPATGNSSWRRDDDAAGGAWTYTGSGAYSPAASQGTHSARFHSYGAPNNSIGTLDLLVNLSAAGPKRLSFDYVNTSGNDSLVVQLSNDGGVTFSSLAGYKLSATFTTQVLPITSTSATAVIRFRARSDFGTTDIGLDNVILELASGCLTPASLSATTTTTTATLSWLTGGSGTYTVLCGPTGFNPATGGTAVTGLTTSPYTLTGLTPGTTYQFYVTQNCAAGANSGTAGPISFTTQIVNDDPCGATVLTVGNACVPTATTTFGATTTPFSVYAGGSQGTGCSTITTPRDVWFTFTTAATGPTSTSVRISVTGNPASVVRAYSGTACAGPLTYIACTGTAANMAAPDLDLNNLTPSTTYYVRVSEYTTASTLGNFTICATPVPNCPGTGGLAATAVTNTTAVLNWSNQPTTGSTFTVIYGPTGFVPSAGTTITGITTNTTTLTGLTANTGYQFYVQQICGGFNGTSGLAGPVSFTTSLTPPTNDDPCGATALTSGTAVNATNVGATTTSTGVPLPGCSGAQVPRDVWFTTTPTAGNNALTLAFTGTAAGQVRVFTAPACATGPFTQVFCQASTGNGVNLGTVTVPGLTAGTTYYISVSGYGSNSTTGAFGLTATSTLLTSTYSAQASDLLLVYPNPSHSGQLTLRLPGLTGAGQATLLNALGQQVLRTDLSSTAEQILSTRGLATGVYTLRVQLGGQVLTRKVVLD